MFFFCFFFGGFNKCIVVYIYINGLGSALGKCSRLHVLGP